MLVFFSIGLSASVDDDNNSIGKPSDHVDYVVMGKSINHRQSVSAKLNLLNTVFFAEIFPVKIDSISTSVTNGLLTGLGDAKDGLNFSSARIPFLAGQREMTIAGFDTTLIQIVHLYSLVLIHLTGSIKSLPATFMS